MLGQRPHSALNRLLSPCLQNSHINELMKKHERAFAEIKNYYNDITHNNLDLIKALKEDVAEMKKREAQNEKLM